MRMRRIRSLGDTMAVFRENWPGYLCEFRFLLIVATVASIADVASTIHFMQRLGPDAEAHPVVRALSVELGTVLGPIAGKSWQFIAMLLVTIFLRRWARSIFIVVSILYLGAAWYNIWGQYTHHPIVASQLSMSEHSQRQLAGRLQDRPGSEKDRYSQQQQGQDPHIRHNE